MAAIVIASLPEARAALWAARSSGVAAELESPPDAASIHGVLWFAELNRALLAEFPGVPFSLTLDCGDRADLAHAALAEGIKRIRFRGHPKAARALQDIAKQWDAALTAASPSQARIYVIAEPSMPAADRDWIQVIRKHHDPRFDLIGPHFTLVFGADPSFASALVARAQEVGVRTASFVFDLQSTRVLSEGPDEHYLVLVPDLGSQELTSLHDALRLERTSPTAFLPHLTIGRVADAVFANTLATQLNDARKVVRGRVSALKAIAVEGGIAHDLATVALAGT